MQHLTESAFADRLCFGSLDRLCIRLSKAVCPCSTSLALTKNKITGRTFLDVSPSDRFFRNQIIPMLLHKWPLLEALRNSSLDRHTKGSRQHRPRRTHCTTGKIPRKRCEQPWLDTYAGRHLPTSQIVFKSTAKPMLGVQWHTKGEEINWLEPKQPRVTRHTHITLIIVQILNLNHHDIKQVQCENKYTYHTKKAKCLHCERRNHHSKLQTNEKSSVLAVRAYNIDGRRRWTLVRLVVTAHEKKTAPPQRWSCDENNCLWSRETILNNGKADCTHIWARWRVVPKAIGYIYIYSSYTVSFR